MIRKTLSAAAVLAAVGAALLTAAPAMADTPVAAVQVGNDSVSLGGNDSNFGGGVNAANNWNFTAAAVCLQEVAVVPVLGDWVGDHVNNCSNGNVIDHSGSH